MNVRFFLCGAMFLGAAGCGGVQSSLDPAAPEAHGIARLMWIFIGVSIVIFALVSAYLAVALVRRREVAAGPVPSMRPEVKRRLDRSVAMAGGATVLILLALLVSTAAAVHAGTPHGVDPPVSIRVIGHQWWWEVQYTSEDPSRTVTTANEIHVPVGSTVSIELVSRDVIHSFWVPRLVGKIDLVPSRINHTTITPEAPGRFRGQCAEFCGYQHALMAFWVVAEPAADFRAWLDHQRAPAAPPSDERAARGAQLFASGPCITCHTIRGTDAAATTGPDLTHLAARDRIGAGVFANTDEQLRTWIVHVQNLKPGAMMPATRFDDEDLGALAAYLGGLK